MIRRWFILGILVIVMVSLLWNFYREVVVYDAMAAARQIETSTRKAPTRARMYSPAWKDAIVSNNLFSKSRGYVAAPVRPTVPDDTEVPVVELIPPELNLNGIILDQYGEFIAFIQEGQGKAKRARVGDEIAGALVVEISEREVKLLWNDEEMILSMKKIRTVPRKK